MHSICAVIDAMFGAQRDQRVQGGVGAAAAGIALDAHARGHDLQRLAGIEAQLRQIRLLRTLEHVDEAALAVQRIGVGGEAVMSEQRGHHAIARRHSGVQWLDHGAEILAYAACAGGGNAQSHAYLAFLQLQQMGRGCCRGQGAQGGCRMPSGGVVRRVEVATQARRDVQPGDIGGDDVAAAAAIALAQGEQRRHEIDRGVPDHGRRGIVVIQGVARGGIGQRRRRGRHAHGLSQYQRHRMTAVGADHGAHRHRLFAGRTGQGAAHRIQQGGLGPGYTGLGDVAVLEPFDKASC